MKTRTLKRTKVPGVFKRGGRYVVVYRETDGRQRRKAAKTLSEADALKASIRTDMQRGEYQAPTRTTVPGKKESPWNSSTVRTSPAGSR